MNTLIAFLKKEVMEQLRSGKFLFLTILFILFGIMNPAVAKLTPWLLEIMADSLAQSGMVVTVVKVTAMDSWVQFFKNIPMALIVFVLIESNIFTKEYQSGTLVLSITKGLARYKIVISKFLTLAVLWSAGFWLCFGITYAYNAYFWDNSIAQNLIFSILCWWLFGLWVIGLMTVFSTVFQENAGVLIGTGSVVLASALLSFFAKLQKYLPTQLMNGNNLIYGLARHDQYTPAILVAAVTLVSCFIASLPLFNKKQL